MNWRYFLSGLICFGAGGAVALFGYDFFHDNKQATEVIVTVFSILAGFLIAVMTLLGDSSLLPGTWRIGEVTRARMKTKLIRQKWLFYLYLLTLLAIFVTSLVRPHWPTATEWSPTTSR